MPTRAVTLAVFVALVGAVVSPGVRAAAPAPGWQPPPRPATHTSTKTALTFAVKVGADDATTCTVDADLFVPSGVDRRHPAPALLTTNGWAGSKRDNTYLGYFYANRGYVVLSYSGLGFGGDTTKVPGDKGSPCLVGMDDRDWDGKAARQLVDFLGGSKAAANGLRVDYVTLDRKAHDGSRRADDPRVGMFGQSYGGGVQFAAAAIDPRIDALVPQITWNDLTYSLSPNGTSLRPGSVSAATPGTEKLAWLTAIHGLGIASEGLTAAEGDTDPSHVGTCAHIDPRFCDLKEHLDSYGYPFPADVAFLRSVSVASYAGQVRVPVLLEQGENDSLFLLNEAVATYRSLKLQKTPVKLLFQSWGHSNYKAAPGEYTLDDSYLGRTNLLWFDHWLLDRKGSTGPEFEYYRDWAGVGTGEASAAAAYGEAPSFPVGRSTALALSGTGDLVSAGPVTAGTSTFATTGQAPASYSDTGAGTSTGLPSTDAPGVAATYQTPVLTRDTDVVGIPTVQLSLSSPVYTAAQSADPTAQCVLFLKLYDVSPDGTRALLHGHVAPIRVADITKPVTADLAGIVHRFAVGHRIALVIAGSDAAYKNNTLLGPVTVTTGPGVPGVLSLPVV